MGAGGLERRGQPITIHLVKPELLEILVSLEKRQNYGFEAYPGLQEEDSTSSGSEEVEGRLPADPGRLSAKLIDCKIEPRNTRDGTPSASRACLASPRWDAMVSHSDLFSATTSIIMVG